jgi:hypothetical protein
MRARLGFVLGRNKREQAAVNWKAVLAESHDL